MGPKLLLIFCVIISIICRFTTSQVLLLPGTEVDDPFKDNSKWARFKLEQHERIQQLQILVDNVWNLFDEIEQPSSSYDFQGSFIKFQFQSFMDFFEQIENQLHKHCVYLTFTAALGIQKITTLFNPATKDHSPLDQLRIKWIELVQMGKFVHKIFNSTSINLFTLEPSTQNKDVIFKDFDEKHSIFLSNSNNEEEIKEDSQLKDKTIDEISKEIDSSISATQDDTTLLRGLIKLLQNIEQSNVDRTERLNYFCYGNNMFARLPDLIDVVSNSLLYLVTADMKKLVLDIYKLTYSAFYDESASTSKEDLIKQRKELWTEMVERVDRKVNFTYFDGKGWDGLEGPIIYKCDLPPKVGHEIYKQWGRNLTTGAHPNASHILENDPQAGPLKTDGTLGYFDDRIPEMNYVAFERTFRGYIEAELLLNPNGNCVGTCNDYIHPTTLCHTDHCPLQRSFHCESNESSCLKPYKSECSVAKNCVRAGPEVQMCSSDSTESFDWLRYSGQVIKSQNGSSDEQCSSGEGKDSSKTLSIAKEKWHLENGNLILAAPIYCELCLCTCIKSQNRNDQDYFDLQPALANVEEGYVITALKFVKEDHVIRLAIQEGKPLINGNIDNSSLKWVDASSFDKEDPIKTAPLGVGPNGGFTKLNFDLLVGPSGTVLTGIRFRVDESQAITLEIQVTPITWENDDKLTSSSDEAKPASLVPKESKWITNTSETSPKISEQNPRQPLNFPTPIKNPISQTGPSMPDITINSFVEFTTTSYESDLAQSIVPYFDAQSVYYHHEGICWLRGAGLIHKGKHDSSGFITPVIVAAKPYSVVRYLPKAQE